MSKRVLVTGAAGTIAQKFIPGLLERFDCTLTDIKETNRRGEAMPGIVPLDLMQTPLPELTERWRGYDCIVHAAAVTPFHTWESELGNVAMARQVLQAAYDAGVPRVILTSSNHAADFYEPYLRSGQLAAIGPETPPRSDNLYGWAKIAYEGLGFVYASGSMGRKLQVICIRIGGPREMVGDQFKGQFDRYNRELAVYLSDRDMQQLYVKSIETPNIEDEWGVPFQIFYGISNNRRAFWSIANARAVIGYAPEDDSEIRFADEIRRLWIDPQRISADA
ncbi:MAG TPA: NAD(P)-dependent oxidoreductase [Limnochordia bacterium]|nr:NAD(P)-dependent oxidoreductase [Limnochordia bacterium]